MRTSFTHIFDSVALPYKPINIPGPTEQLNNEQHYYYYVNKVITNLTRDTFKRSGFKLTQDRSRWNASWGRQFIESEYRKCEAWQKINHFGGAFKMGKKNELHKRMQELRSRVGNFASFYPESYLLPQDQKLLNMNWKNHRIWIVKPAASSRGRGIYMLSSSDCEPVTNADFLVQVYIPNPLLIEKRKFDIRLYVLVTRLEPLRIYIHSAGLARFCTHEYDPDGDINDQQMHLTNFSVNKTDKKFVKNDDLNKENVHNSKWSLKFFMQSMKSMGLDTDALMKEFERISIATIIAGVCEIKKTHNDWVQHRHTSYEMYGLDIMLDSNMKCHLIEVNISPSLSGMDSNLDKKLKLPLNLDLLRMAQIIDCNCLDEDPCPAITKIDNRYYETMTKDRVKKVEAGLMDPWEDPTFADYVIIRDFLDETKVKSDFRLIYPLPDTMESYFPCFDKLSYQDIVFTRWLKMQPQQRQAALQKNFKEYEAAMRSITAPPPSTPPTSSQ